MAPRFGIHNAALQGALYLAPAAGNIVGSRISGPASDRAYRRGMQKRKGVAVPEERLRCTLIWALCVQPLALAAYGLTIQFYAGTGGAILALFFQVRPLLPQSCFNFLI